jgi:hypothetical protein
MVTFHLDKQNLYHSLEGTILTQNTYNNLKMNYNFQTIHGKISIQKITSPFSYLQLNNYFYAILKNEI